MLQDKEYREWARAAVAQGWRVREAKDGVVLYPSDGGRPVALHGGHTRGLSRRRRANQKAQLRRRGLTI